jgi:hypothetical protein
MDDAMLSSWWVSRAILGREIRDAELEEEVEVTEEDEVAPGALAEVGEDVEE